MKEFERKRSLSTSKNFNKPSKNITSLINNLQYLQSERANKSSQSERNQENIKFQLNFFENLIDYSKSLTNKSLCLILSNKLNKLYLKTPNIYTNNNNNPINNNNNDNNNNQINNTNNSNIINNINNVNNNNNNDFYNIYKHFTLILVSLLFMSKFEILYKKSSNKVQTYLIEFIIYSLFHINKISSQKIINFLTEFEHIHLSKTLNLSEITKNFSSSIFKISESYINIEKCINDLNLNINNLSLSKLISIINESILFCMDSNINVNIEIENNNNNNNDINQIIKTPYITTKMQKNFCLVLDLDETITHNTPANYFLVRPGTINFLTEISKYYEIIIFTSAHQNYADNILNRLDPEKKFISYRFYKQHTYIEENKIVKNIKNLGRDLKKIIFIDNIKYVAKYSMENIYQIKTWIDDVFDNELERIKNKLIEIAKNKKYLKDVRKAIKELI